MTRSMSRLEHQAMDPDEFVSLALRIVEAKGVRRETMMQDGLEFADDRVRIRTNFNGLDIEVTRLPIDEPAHPELRVQNPTTMVKGGAVIRHHGEHAYIAPRLVAIAAALE